VLRAAALALWAVVLAALTLSYQDPTHMDPSVPRLSICLVCGERGTSDAILNILLFTPLGFLLHGRRWSVLRIAALALLLSSSIEVAQHFIPGRYSNLGDVVWNTTGAVLGAWVWSVRASRMPPAPTRGRLVGNAAVVVAVGITMAFGWLMEPDWPLERYWGQWTPELHFMDTYGGSVERARLDSMPIPPGRFPKRHDPRTLLLGDWTMEATAVKGLPPRALAPVLNLYDGREREVTMLGATGEDLVYRERSRARMFSLDQPDLRLPGALAAVGVGEPMELVVRRRGGERCLEVDGREACPGFTPGRAWSLLMYPEEVHTLTRRTLDAVWAFALLLPVGLWSRRWRNLALRALLAAAGIAIAIAVTRLTGPTLAEVAAALLGSLTGFAMRPVLARVSNVVVD
jgi:hypothetical protein